jgi:hypothetical protein
MADRLLAAPIGRGTHGGLGTPCCAIASRNRRKAKRRDANVLDPAGRFVGHQ